jgi:hypothetical protein
MESPALFRSHSLAGFADDDPAEKLAALPLCDCVDERDLDP